MSRILKKDDNFLKLKQVISKVAIEKSKIYELVSNGQFPAPIKIGTMSRWIESEVTAWMQSNVQV